MKLHLFLAALFVAGAPPAAAQTCTGPVAVCDRPAAGSFALIRDGKAAPVYIDADADSAVRHVAASFVEDIGRVGASDAALIGDLAAAKGDIVIIGEVGKSRVIDRLVASGRIDVKDVAGKWEAYRQLVVDNPVPGIARALVIVGADRRGAVFGTYDLSEKIGVSPWYWWADVPVRKQRNLFLTPGSRADQPKVKYRGFFINDEDPGFSGWAKKHYGGINAHMYAHVFELLLRLKGNYLWPAMWAPKAFNDDDPQNKVLADEMGVVMGTSHHEPMTRAQDEWHRNTGEGVTGGKWDYATNAANLRTFWRGGIERMMSKGDGKPYESLVTIGMRGDGDEAMAEGTATQLLETIVADQRRIIAEVTGKPASETAQVWALYKEVQDYYDHGMRVPDDVVLLFADDNWGQIRRLPTADRDRKGGYGIYYHFDYVGGPRNYKWLNTNQIEKTWQQMDLAYAGGARALWIVNVGDIKPMEFPLSFFLKQAWDPEAMTLEAMTRYPEDWARETFGPEHAREIAALLTRYGQYAARRKPELIDADSFRLGDGIGDRLDGGEFGAMVAEWQALEREMLRVGSALPQDQRPAYFQLIEHPITAFSNLYELYYAVAWNRRLAEARDPRANAFADRAETAYRRDQAITDAYHAVSGGKWGGMMAQTHIGYTNWQQPAVQGMPEVKRLPASGAPRPILFAKPVRSAPDAVIAIEAPDYARARNGKGLTWRTVPNLGRTLGAVGTFPQGRAPTDERDAVRLEYDVVVRKPGDLTLALYLVPTLDVTGKAKLRVGVSVDDGPMQVITDSLLPAPNATTLQAQRDWNQAVMDNARVVRTALGKVTAGKHRIKLWRIDDNVLVQKLVLATGPVPPSYLGPIAK